MELRQASTGGGPKGGREQGNSHLSQVLRVMGFMPGGRMASRASKLLDQQNNKEGEPFKIRLRPQAQESGNVPDALLQNSMDDFGRWVSETYQGSNYERFMSALSAVTRWGATSNTLETFDVTQ